MRPLPGNEGYYMSEPDKFKDSNASLINCSMYLFDKIKYNKEALCSSMWFVSFSFYFSDVVESLLLLPILRCAVASVAGIIVFVCFYPLCRFMSLLPFVSCPRAGCLLNPYLNVLADPWVAFLRPPCSGARCT